MSFLKKYAEHIANPFPSTTWKVVRGVLHWLSLPIKLILIGGLGNYQIFKNRHKNGRVPDIDNRSLNNKLNLAEFVKSLPVWKTNNFESYVCRQPSHKELDGKHHNPDHQCARNGTYAFILSQTVEGKALRGENLEKGIRMHMQVPYLARGYKYTEHAEFVFNMGTTSGDMLCGLNLAVLTTENLATMDMYDQLVDGIIKHDYALLEGTCPEKGDLLYDLYKAEYVKQKQRYEKIKIKSERGMWQPGLETVGAQALTILSTLKLSYYKTKDPEAKREYNRLFYRYGYGLLSLFPTAYIDSKRGYFNDHNCMVSLYVLLKTSESKLEKWIYKKAMVYVWRLSKHWYNGYFTGLLLDACPELLKEEEYGIHLRRCLLYLQESENNLMDVLNKPIEHSRRQLTPNEIPARIHQMSEDEFYPDIEHNVAIDATSANGSYYRTGLGYYASYVMCLKVYDKLKKQSSGIVTL